MKLIDYLKMTDQTVASFSRKCNLTEFKVRNAIDRTYDMSLKTALIIEKITNGDVSALELCNEEFQENFKKIKSPFRKIS